MGYKMQVRFQTWDDGVLDRDDGLPGRGRVTTLMSHQSEILHSISLMEWIP